MSLRIHLRDGPERAIALVTKTHALTFRLAPRPRAPPTGQPKPRQCMLDFQSLDAVDMSSFAPMRTPAAHGTLGLFAVQGDVFVCVITGAAPAASVRPGENVQRIVSVEFLCLTRSDFDGIAGSTYGSDYNPADRDLLYDDRHGLDEPTAMHPCQALQQVLSAGTFYYSVDFDLTTRLQARIHERTAFDPDALDRGFLWNGYLLEPLLQFRSHLTTPERKALDDAHILTLAIRGYVGAVTIPSAVCPLRADKHHPSMLTIISRLSCRRAGTRFNARGIDDAGNVANFVETETIYYAPDDRCFSYTQIRGSVPVFWEQTGGLLPHQQKIQLTRSREATQPAFDKHFEDLELRYGTVQIFNLLGQNKMGEMELTRRYNEHIRACSINARVELPKGRGNADAEHAMLQATHFDLNAETRGGGYGQEVERIVRALVQGPMDGFAYFMAVGFDPSHTAVLLQQEGVFRVNCLDCLDRTNLVQTMLSRFALDQFFAQQQHQMQLFGTQKHSQRDPAPAAPGQVSAGFWPRHSTLWADNGDALSKIYAGTGALKSSFTRHGKISLAGALADARKGATRLYMQAFVDTQRQAVIDALLGRASLTQSGEAVAQEGSNGSVQLYDPVHTAVNAALAARKDVYTTAADVTVWAGTFNLNGRRDGLRADLTAWLRPRLKMSNGSFSNNKSGVDVAEGWTSEEWTDGNVLPDIVAVGFQEIVELNTNNIMATDPTRRQEWEEAVSEALNGDRREKKAEYVLLRSGQLVGAALILFMRSASLSMIRNAEGAIKKTGMSGMAGNKGAVAIRLDYAQTRLCFVTAHLAAGFANYEERNRDYSTIAHGLRFPRGRGIADHDAVIWLGDFNYRIGLPNEKVRPVAFDDASRAALFRHDQLTLQMVAGHAFAFFREAPLHFAPTYRYDVGTDTYDSSEKQRIPAWTDRILWRGEGVRALAYGAAPLRVSDHRPVCALFRVSVAVEDEKKKAALRAELDQLRRQKVGNGGSRASMGSSSEDDLLGEVTGVQAASSERSRWWLGNGLPARSTVADNHPGATPNPQRPPNPFTPSAEPDWVMVARPKDAAAGASASKTKAAPPDVPAPRRSKVEPPPPPVQKQTQQQQPPPDLPPPRRSKVPPPPPSTTPPVSSSSQTPPQPLARVGTNASSTTSGTRARTISGASSAAAPPIPRKPLGLSSASPLDSSSGPPPPLAESTRPPPSSSPVAAVPAAALIETGFPPPPRRLTGGGGGGTGPPRSVPDRTPTVPPRSETGHAVPAERAGPPPPPPLPQRQPTDPASSAAASNGGGGGPAGAPPMAVTGRSSPVAIRNVMDDDDHDDDDEEGDERERVNTDDGLSRFVALKPKPAKPPKPKKPTSLATGGTVGKGV